MTLCIANWAFSRLVPPAALAVSSDPTTSSVGRVLVEKVWSYRATNPSKEGMIKVVKPSVYVVGSTALGSIVQADIWIVLLDFKELAAIKVRTLKAYEGSMLARIKDIEFYLKFDGGCPGKIAWSITIWYRYDLCRDEVFHSSIILDGQHSESQLATPCIPLLRGDVDRYLQSQSAGHLTFRSSVASVHTHQERSLEWSFRWFPVLPGWFCRCAFLFDAELVVLRSWS